MRKFFAKNLISLCLILLIGLLLCPVSANVVFAADTPAGTSNVGPLAAPATDNSGLNLNQVLNDNNQGPTPLANSQQAQQNKNDNNLGQSGSSWWNILNPLNWIPAAVRLVGQLWLALCGWILGVSALLLNKAIIFSVVDMKKTLDSIPAILVIWKVIRDLLNSLFIFILLYVSIGTILGLQKVNWKSTVFNLFIAAILINFSLFFTRVAVDLSNLAALGFYEQLPGVTAITPDPNSGFLASASNNVSNVSGLSEQFMYYLGIQSIYDINGHKATNSILGQNIQGTEQWLITVILGTIIMLYTSFIFGVAAILFIWRFAIILLLLATSPVMFANYIWPNWKGYVSTMPDWKAILLDEVIFAPVFMLFVWMSLKLLDSPILRQFMSNSYTQTVTSPNIANLNIIFMYILAMILLSFTLVAAKKISGSGASVATKYAGKLSFGLAAAVGRNTVGRVATNVGGSKWVQDKILSRVPLAAKTLDKASKSSFDLRNVKTLKKFIDAGEAPKETSGGYKGVVENKAKNYAETAKLFKSKEAKENFAKTIQWQKKILPDPIFKFMFAVRSKAAETILSPKKMKALQEDINVQKELIDSNKKTQSKLERLRDLFLAQTSLNTQILALGARPPNDPELQSLNRRLTQTQSKIDQLNQPPISQTAVANELTSVAQKITEARNKIDDLQAQIEKMKSESK